MQKNNVETIAKTAKDIYSIASLIKEINDNDNSGIMVYAGTENYRLIGQGVCQIEGILREQLNDLTVKLKQL